MGDAEQLTRNWQRYDIPGKPFLALGTLLPQAFLQGKGTALG